MRKRLIGRAIATVLVVVALVPITWFVFAAVTGGTLIVFRTGSMAPTMPQGAVAVSMPVAAAEIAVGDVVTVQRDDRALPVTHRVVEVTAGSGATRELVLKGDDNDTVDTEPYEVTEARRVVFAVPHVGTVLMILQSPIGMGAMVIVAAALTVWAFWPRREGAPEAAEEVPSMPETESGAEPVSSPEPAPDSRRARRLAAQQNR